MSDYKLFDEDYDVVPVLKRIKTAQGKSKLPADTTSGMAYIPYQEDADMYEAEKGLAAGTVFPELDKPFKGRMV